MKLPNLEAAVVAENKITEYLLNPLHPDGAGKAKFFAALSFRAEEWQILAAALRGIAAAAEVTQSVASVHGQKYVVDGPLETPCGKSPVVRTVWIIDQGKAVPRLVTAYPHEREDENA
jgi:hypothetical protein